MTVPRGRVVAFRLGGHHLVERNLKRSSLRAFAAAGLRSTEGTPLPALAARVAGVKQADLDRLLSSKTLVETLSARTGATIAPTSDHDVFTLGSAPGEESLRFALKPFLRTFESADLSAAGALELACDVGREALHDGRCPGPSWPR